MSARYWALVVLRASGSAEKRELRQTVRHRAGTRWGRRSGQQRRKRLGRHRRQQPEALSERAAQVDQHLSLGVVLDALGDHGEAEAVGDAEDGFRDDSTGRFPERGDEGPVDLESVDGKALQIAQ